MRTVSWILLLLLAASAPQAIGADVDSAPVDLEIPAAIDASWQLSAAAGTCQLEQPLPDVGTLRFLAAARAPLRVEMLTHRQLFAEGAVTVRRRAPAWHPQFPSSEPLGELAQLDGGSLIASDPLASSMLLALYEGYQVSFERRGQHGDGLVAVSVSGVGVRTHFDAFTRCASGTLARGWLAMERSRIAFPSGGSALTAAAQARLDEIAAFVRADPSVRRVYVDGHTDDSGTRAGNLRLAEQRAGNVAAYLSSQGVSSELLTVRYHGARYPVAENVDEAGRARNRRATVRLERNWTLAANADVPPEQAPADAPDGAPNG